MSNKPPLGDLGIDPTSAAIARLCEALLILLASLLLLVCWFAASVLAKPPLGVKLDPTISAWFHSLTIPGSDTSCCDTADGRVLRDDEWRVTEKGYEAKIAGAWVSIPPQLVLRRVDNPTGGAVLFVYGRQPICFVRPVES